MSEQPHSQGSICWHECGTRDAAAAKAFYTELFGWEAEDHDMPGDRGGAYTILRRDGRDVAGLYEMCGEHFEGVPPHWATYVWMDDIDGAAAKATELGGKVLQAPMDVPGVGRMAVVQDPQGAVLQLFKGVEHQGAAVTDGSPGSFCWSELCTTDTAGAGRFYGELVGWAAEEREMADGTKYTIFKSTGRMDAGMLPMTGEMWKGIPPHWKNYVAVADVDATAAKALELGGQVVVPPTDMAGVGRFTVLKDPTGAVLSAITMAAPG
jgi:predicted enzyme related to lactoylglutathione lyase